MATEKPTEEQIAKLPKWAQDHIRHLEIERNAATRTLKAFVDKDTPSNVFFDEHPCLGENLATGEKTNSPQFTRCYVQTKRIQFKLPRAEMEMEVYVNEEEHRVEIRTPKGYPFIEPVGGNIFYLVPREDMYLRPNAQDICRAVLDRSKLSHDAFVEKYGFSQEDIEAKISETVPKSRLMRNVR